MEAKLDRLIGDFRWGRMDAMLAAMNPAHIPFWAPTGGVAE
jgi:hypothetical protein